MTGRGAVGKNWLCLFKRTVQPRLAEKARRQQKCDTRRGCRKASMKRLGYEGCGEMR